MIYHRNFLLQSFEKFYELIKVSLAHSPMNFRHSIDFQDSLTLIDIHKTGHQRPGDILFEDNGRPQTQSIGQRSPKASKKGKTGLFRSKEKVNHLFFIYHHSFL